MTNITTFNYLSSKVRVIEIDGQPWFAAADTCQILELGHVASALLRMESDEVRLVLRSNVDPIHVSFPNRGLKFVSESGLYKLIMRSDKPEARQFQDWVTREVLPSIRKDGGYIAGEELAHNGIVCTAKINTGSRPASAVVPENTHRISVGLARRALTPQCPEKQEGIHA